MRNFRADVHILKIILVAQIGVKVKVKILISFPNTRSNYFEKSILISENTSDLFQKNPSGLAVKESTCNVQDAEKHHSTCVC